MLTVIKMKKTIKKTVTFPDKVSIEIEASKVTVNGPSGKMTLVFNIGKIKLKKIDNKIELECNAATKKEKKVMNTIAAHIANMICGVTNGFEYKLQVCSIHFPITVKVDKERNLLVIKNFLGERKDREVKLLEGVDIAVEGDIIKLNGNQIERVAQCAANIETATKIKSRDRRVYQDGIFMISKAGVEV